MKWIVFLVLISNISFAQELIPTPRKILEACRTNYDRIDLMEDIINDKDSIINNRDIRIETTDSKVEMLKQSFDLMTQKYNNQVTITNNKDQEIRVRKGQRNKLVKAIVGLSILELSTIVLTILLL